MAMESNLAASMQPMYDPRRVNITHQQPKPDSTVPSPPGSENKVLEAANESTLADLASSEISLDLQVRNQVFTSYFEHLNYSRFWFDGLWFWPFKAFFLVFSFVTIWKYHFENLGKISLPQSRKIMVPLPDFPNFCK